MRYLPVIKFKNDEETKGYPCPSFIDAFKTLQLLREMPDHSDENVVLFLVKVID